MECQSIIRELKRALKKDDEGLREEVKRIIARHSRKPARKADFQIKKGGVYLINESRPRVIRSVFFQVVDRGLPGLFISRTKPEEFGRDDMDGVDFVWLSTVNSSNSIEPSNLPKLQNAIIRKMKSSQGSVIAIEGIETIITNTDFKRTLGFIQRVRDVAADSKGIILISVDLKTLSEKEKALLRKEMSGEIPSKLTG